MEKYCFLDSVEPFIFLHISQHFLKEFEGRARLLPIWVFQAFFWVILFERHSQGSFRGVFDDFWIALGNELTRRWKKEDEEKEKNHKKERQGDKRKDILDLIPPIAPESISEYQMGDSPTLLSGFRPFYRILCMCLNQYATRNEKQERKRRVVSRCIMCKKRIERVNELYMLKLVSTTLHNSCEFCWSRERRDATLF